MYCSNCGTPNAEPARFCEKCGRPIGAVSINPPVGAPGLPPPVAYPPGYAPQQSVVRGMQYPPGQVAGKVYVTGKSPGVALLLSFLIPGVGQFYNGDAKKGGVMLGGYIVSIFLTAIAIGFFGIMGIWIWGMIDAHSVASGKTPTW
jgi:TM2 domain-containing membrane protein YozV